MEDWFDLYARNRLGVTFAVGLVPERKCVEVCIAAMESGDLPVCSVNLAGKHLWSTYFLTPDDWIRICRLRPPLTLLWGRSSKIVFVWDGDFANAAHIAALRQIDYLWQDLEAVQAYAAFYGYVLWLSKEVRNRALWRSSDELRRAWMTAVVMFA
jgi:hypothetical protein